MADDAKPSKKALKDAQVTLSSFWFSNSRWSANKVRDEQRLDMLLEGVRDGTCTDVMLTPAVNHLGKIIVTKVGVRATTTEPDQKRYNVHCDVSHQYLCKSLCFYDCAVVDMDTGVQEVGWHTIYKNIPPGTWERKLTIVALAPAVKSARKT